MNFIEIVILIGAVQGLMLFLGLLIRNWAKKNLNYYFLFLIAALSLSLLAKLVYSEERYYALPALWFLIDTITYLVGPLWYFTVLRSTCERLRLSWWIWLLLSPVLYHIIFIIRVLGMNPAEFLAYESSEAMTVGFYVFCTTAVFVNGAFFFLTHRFLRRYKASSFPRLLVHGQTAMLSLVAAWVLVIVMARLPGALSLNASYDLAFSLLAIFSFALGMLAIVKPASFYFLTQTYDASEQVVLEKIAHKITGFMLDQRPYLQSDFSLKELSEAIGYNTVLTSKAINRVHKVSFSDFLSQYRIEHFLELAQSGKAAQFTHWAMAEQSGFGNRVSFYNAFKKLKGTTPKLYLSSVGNE